MVHQRRGLLATAPIPREHGAWSIFLASAATGVAIAPAHGAALAALIPGLLLLFLALRPLSALARGRQTAESRSSSARWACAFLAPGATLYALSAIASGSADLALIAGSGAFLGALNLALVRMRIDRAIPSEIAGSMALTLALPAAYAASAGSLDARVMTAWGVATAFFSGSVIYVRHVTKGGGHSAATLGAFVLLAASGTLLAARWAPIQPLCLAALAPSLAHFALAAALPRRDRARTRTVGFVLVGHTVLLAVVLVLACRVLSR